MDSLGSFLPFLLFGAVAVLLVGGAWYAGHKRRKDLEAMCLANGFEFDETGMAISGIWAYKADAVPPSSYSDSSGFAAIGGQKPFQDAITTGSPYSGDPAYKKSGLFGLLMEGVESPLGGVNLKIFHTGHSRKVSNLVMAPFKKGKLFFFDYKYTTGSGKHSHTHVFTLALMKTSSNLPDFYLRPENFLHKIADFIGFDDIDIPGFDEFSKRYRLTSPSPETVLPFFSNERVRMLEGGPLWNAYAGGNYLVVFKKEKHVPVADYPTHIEEVKMLINCLNLE